MKIDNKTGLVLEGGGMRGVFTCGVLDYFLDQQIYFPYCVAVSAGACNGISYISHQRSRAKYTCIDLLKKFKYIGVKHIWSQHSILDQDFMYDTIPNEILPFDYNTYFNNPATFEMVTTNCKTGRACYLTEKKDKQRFLDIVKASSSLPFVCPIINVDGEPMLDGGIIDSIPVERAISTGHAFNIVVLTRNRGYRSTTMDIKTPKFIYRDYPRLRLVLSKRQLYYNQQLEMIEKMEDEGSILAIRPIRPMEVDRLENDFDKLTALYEEGYACAKKAFENVDIELIRSKH